MWRRDDDQCSVLVVINSGPRNCQRINYDSDSKRYGGVWFTLVHSRSVREAGMLSGGTLRSSQVFYSGEQLMT
jgi:hypothetical protein